MDGPTQPHQESSADRLDLFLDTLDLGRVPGAVEVYVAPSQRTAHGRILGAQLLAQCVYAAGMSVAAPARVTSMHTNFVHPGEAAFAVRLTVHTLHRDETHTVRSVDVTQGDRLLCTSTARFGVHAPIPTEEPARPIAVPPESLDRFSLHDDGMREHAKLPFAGPRPFEHRYVIPSVHFGDLEPTAPRQSVWLRARGTLPTSPLVHAAALAYATDYSILESAYRPTGVPTGRAGVQTASLDHAMWWHADARADEWHLSVEHSPSMSNGRGLGTASIYDRDGLLVATAMQEGLIRLPLQS